MKKKNINSLDVALIVFITLKVSGVVDWNWFIVFSPLFVEIVCLSILAMLNTP